MASPHVLIVIENLPLQRDARVKRQCAALLDAGYDVSVIAPRGSEPLPGNLRPVALHAYPAFPEIGTKLGFVAEYAYSFLLAAALILRVRASRRINVVQVCNPPDIYFPIGFLLKLSGTSFLFDHHDLSPELYASRYGDRDTVLARALRLLERATIRTANHVIVTNESVGEVAVGRGGKPPAAVTVVRNGPELERRRQGRVRPELKGGHAHLCVWLGVVGDDDGVDLALRAAAHLVHDMGRRDCGFVFIGDGEMLESCKRLTEALDVTAFVSYTGWLSQEAAFDYLATADIGMAPDPKNARSDSATMMKVMEYMLMELPVVAFDVKETRISAGAAGVYARGNDTREYAELIDELLRDEERRAAMGSAGRRRVEDGLAWDHQRQAYIDVFDSLVDNMGEAPRSGRHRA